MTPQEKALWLRTEHGARFDKLFAQAQRLLESPASVRSRSHRLTTIADELAETVATVAICRKGCAHCCKQSVLITQWEADRISAHAGRTQARIKPGWRERRSSSPGVFATKPCTFLVDDVCSIYPARPMACRTHISMEEDAELCNILTHGGGRVAMFNFNVLKIVGISIDPDCKVADIREFFPEKKK